MRVDQIRGRGVAVILDTVNIDTQTFDLLNNSTIVQ